MNPICDGYRDAHDAEIIGEDNSAILWYCKLCSHEGRIGKDERGIPDNYQFNEIFQRLTMQGNNALLYKYHPKLLKS